jgi:hypothetical protein
LINLDELPVWLIETDIRVHSRIDLPATWAGITKVRLVCLAVGGFCQVESERCFAYALNPRK